MIVLMSLVALAAFCFSVRQLYSVVRGGRR
jgi:hypothetical protein